MTRVAAIDCGTNSIRLLIADHDGDRLQEVLRRTEIVRLGQGVDVSGRIAPEAMERTLARSREYAGLAREHGVTAARFVATSASRDASNAGEFVQGVVAAFGDLDVAPEVVSGDEEAALSFAGATIGLAASGAESPYLVVDLGGGSTELVRGSDTVEQAISLDMGSVRLTERYLRSDPPTPEEIRVASAEVDAALDLAERTVDLSGVRTLVGLAGSITTVTAHALDLERYDSGRIHHARVPVERVLRATTELLQADHAERAALGFMHPGRVDVIGAGALIWQRIVDRVAQRSGITEAVTSESDILDGIALSVPTRKPVE